MAGTVSKISYQKLKQEVIFEEDVHRNKSKRERISEIIRRSSSSIRLRSRWFSKLKLRRKFRVKLLGGKFKRFFRIRRNKKLKVARLAWAANKVYKRLKDSQSHFGDLFAGNYLFMQVTPASFKAKPNTNTHFVSSHQFYTNNYSIINNNNRIPRFPSSYNNNNNYLCS